MNVARRFLGIVAVGLFLLTIVSTATAKYSGGTGEPNDPYQIATAADLIALGETPADYDKHFLLTADIDLDPNLAGCKVFDKAVIAGDIDPTEEYCQGTPFIGVLDGSGHKVSNVVIKGGGYVGLFGHFSYGSKVMCLGLVDVDIAGSGDYVGGLLGFNNGGSMTQCYITGVVRGTDVVGGLVGFNTGFCEVTHSHSTALVMGVGYVGGLVGENWGTIKECRAGGHASGVSNVGGLVGANRGGCSEMKVGWCVWASVTDSYSSTEVSGTGDNVGGLVGHNAGAVSHAYAIGAVTSGGEGGGGLVGSGGGSVAASLWDTQTSGQTTSAGGTGKTTAEMQTVSTFLDAGWDFVGETANGTEDIWWILEGKDYPRLWWEGSDEALRF